MEKRRWTVEEEQILIKCIEENPCNLTEAFRVSSTKLNRTVKSIQVRWYGNSYYYKGTLKVTNGLRTRTNTTFMTISNKKSASNTKVIAINTNNTYTRVTKSIWKKLISLFKK